MPASSPGSPPPGSPPSGSAPPASAPKRADRLGYLVKHAQLRLAGLTAAALAPFGISGRQLSVLLAIAEEPPASQLDVANRMGVDRTTMVSLIDELEGKGLVERRPDPADRRRNVIALTSLGRETTERAAAVYDQVERSFLAPLSAGDAATVRRALRLLAFPDGA